MYWATGIPGRLRFRQTGQWGGLPAPYAEEQDIPFLKVQVARLREDLGAIENRIKELASDDKAPE
jgi:hypothetical protein